MQTLNSVDLDGVGASAADIRAHGVKEVCKVDYMRLSRRIFNYCSAAGHGCRENDIHRCADGYLIKIYLRAVQLAALRLGIHKAVADIDLRAKGVHALYMLVDRTDAEVASAGHSCLRAAESAEHRTDEVIRCADFAHQLKGSVAEANITAVYFYSAGADHSDLGAELSQYCKEHIGIADLRHILYAADPVYHQRCRDYCDRSILCSAYIDLALKRFPAVNDVLFHMLHLS